MPYISTSPSSFFLWPDLLALATPPWKRPCHSWIRSWDKLVGDSSYPPSASMLSGRSKLIDLNSLTIWFQTARCWWSTVLFGAVLGVSRTLARVTSRVWWSDEPQCGRLVTMPSYSLTTRSRITSPLAGLDTSWSSPLDSQNCHVALTAASVVADLNYSSSCALKSPTITVWYL